ncbi:UDP-glycosyltransferase 85A7 [Citrus sinensis]|uniref:UDP-glycosyltransferase 85A7 n=1 Tax=Citrus sinensis TaxID=2711 RepID=A0ACB8JWZ2_CITSI|nr:UDP-glycosyltransferase 85A7 [Citrus sinensis]
MVYHAISNAPSLSVQELFSTVACKPSTSLSEPSGQWRRPTCIITGGIMSFATIDVADELRIPVIAFGTDSASYENMEKPVTSIPGFENVFRRTDLPGICRVETVDEYTLQFLIGETSSMSIRASAFVINTCNEIEAPMVSRLSSFISKIYTSVLYMRYTNQVNSRCVREVGKIGLDMKDTCDRSTVEKLVRNLIDNKRKEIMEPMDRGATVARDAVKEGGSSFKATWTG